MRLQALEQQAELRDGKPFSFSLGHPQYVNQSPHYDIYCSV